MQIFSASVNRLRFSPRVNARRNLGEERGRPPASVPTAELSYARRQRANLRFERAACLTVRPAKC
jgi:hypothetical protein